MNRRRQDRRITSTFSRAGNEHHATRAAEHSGGPCTYKVSRILERVPPGLRFRCPLDAKSFVRGPKIDPPGAPGTVFDLNAHLVVMSACVFSMGRHASEKIPVPVGSGRILRGSAGAWPGEADGHRSHISMVWMWQLDTGGARSAEWFFVCVLVDDDAPQPQQATRANVALVACCGAPSSTTMHTKV